MPGGCTVTMRCSHQQSLETRQTHTHAPQGPRPCICVSCAHVCVCRAQLCVHGGGRVEAVEGGWTGRWRGAGRMAFLRHHPTRCSAPSSSAGAAPALCLLGVGPGDVWPPEHPGDTAGPSSCGDSGKGNGGSLGLSFPICKWGQSERCPHRKVAETKPLLCRGRGRVGGRAASAQAHSTLPAAPHPVT